MKHFIDKSIHGKSINEINMIIISHSLLIGRNWLNDYSMIQSDDINDIWSDNITGIHTELATFDSLYKLENYIIDKFNNSADYYQKHNINNGRILATLKALDS